MSVLGLFLCVRLTLILAEAQHVPGAARRGLRRLAGHHLTRHQRLHVPDRPRPGEQWADRGGPRPHSPAGRRRSPPSVLALEEPSRAWLKASTGSPDSMCTGHLRPSGCLAWVC